MDDEQLLQAELLTPLAALGRSLGEEFDPRRFLDRFSTEVERLIPHDRLVIGLLDDPPRTFTIFAERAGPRLRVHEANYTTTFDPETRYVVAEWGVRPVFAGEVVRVDDLPTDARRPNIGPVEQKLLELGIRSALVVPLRSGSRIIGMLSATSLTANLYTDAHVTASTRLAELIGPFIENVALLQQVRRRRRRLRMLQELTHALGASLNVRDVFARLAEAVRPVLDFDIMGVALFSPSGHEVEVLAEIGADQPADETSWPIPLEHFSLGGRIRAGEAVLIEDAPRELDPERPGDRRMLEGGCGSALIVPLQSGEAVRGALYFGKRRLRGFDQSDVEIAAGIATQVMLAVQHQQLAEDQRRLALAEGRARRLEERLESIRHELHERYSFDRIVGRSPALRTALARAARVAPTGATVLITGESGTGKELVARAIHAASPRAEGPFVAINCAALPEALLESELFGHERGAFTGADRQKPGRFEQAAGGTLFLDEVAELSPSVQAKLLRVLQEREFHRIGGTATLRADVRLVAATNRDLERAVAEGRFREDLYYRLQVFPVHLPSLRERGDDVLLLADHFVRTLGMRMSKVDVGLSEAARTALLTHLWPGNIRELQNAIERALIVSDGGLITPEQLGIVPQRQRPTVEAARAGVAGGPHAVAPSAARPAARTPAAPDETPPAPVEGTLADLERRMVENALKEARGNRSQAARLLGLTRSQLYTRMKRFGLGA